MEDNVQITVNDMSNFLCELKSIIDAYNLTLTELSQVIALYAEWRDLTIDANLEDTLYMEDGTPLTPALTRYLYHQMYGLLDMYDYDEEDIADE